MSSQVVGLIEVDASLQSIGWGCVSRVGCPSRFAGLSSDYAGNVAGGGAVCPTEFVEVDSQQLVADLEAELAQLKRHLSK